MLYLLCGSSQLFVYIYYTWHGNLILPYLTSPHLTSPSLPFPSLPFPSLGSISDMTTPQERMVQVVKWYVSAFHAGRKSEVARKPYNPILGEVFR